MRNITLKQLRYFVAIARHGHFGRAAEAASITQPALSMQIAALESELGLTLVERMPAGARLTEAGQEIARRAQAILVAVAELGALADSRQGVLSGRLRLGVIPTVAPYLLPALLGRMAETFPDLDLRLRETLTETLVAELLAGALDVLILALPVDHPDIQTLALFDDPFFLACPEDGAPDGPALASMDLLAETRVLLLEEGHCFRDQALEVCRMRQKGDVDTFGASSLSTLVRLVARGMGVTLLPELSLEAETRGQDIRVMAFAEPVPARTLGLAWRRSSPRGRDFQALGDAIGEVTGQGAGPAGPLRNNARRPG